MRRIRLRHARCTSRRVEILETDGREPCLEHAHTQDAIRERIAAGPPQSFLRDWVYGGIDGTVTTFAIVSGVVGAHLSPGIILILGGASLVADGFAMAAGNYVATRAEHDEFRYTEAVERRHIELAPAGERDEVREILRGYGLRGDLLDGAVSAVTADREQWVRMMLRGEYGLPAVVRSAWQAAVSTFSAFLVCGLVPLLPFAAGAKNAFEISAATTGLMFILIGALKSRWSTRPWWYSGLSTLLIGGGAAIVAYLTGGWLRHFGG